MSLFTTMNVATSGLGASSSSLSVIGDNIANIGTTGYKANRTEFADQLPQNVYGSAGISQLGTGTGMTRISTVFGQGSITSSENALDMAIGGDGFFVVADGVSDYYTRAGEFYLDDDGFVISAEELNLQGYNATNGTLGATLGDLQIDLNALAPAETEALVMAANLSADADFATTPVSALTLTTGTGDTVEDASDQADFATSVTVYDTLGVAHEVTLVFERTGTNDWDWYALTDAGETEITALGGTGTDGSAYQISGGSLTFDTSGNLTTFTQTDVTGWNFEGASANPAYTYDFGIDTAGTATDGQVRMNNGDSAVTSITQDGYGTGVLLSLDVNTDGIITGSYSNGEELTMGQVALARFQSNQGLDRVGGNLYRETVDSNSPAVGAPDTGGRGTIAGNALEESNVDLEEQFVHMITSQRSYQANARVVNTANETLQELVNLV